MTPCVTYCTQEQIRQIIEFRQRGWYWKEISDAMGINPNTLARYERVYNLYGKEAFRGD